VIYFWNAIAENLSLKELKAGKASDE